MDLLENDPGLGGSGLDFALPRLDLRFTAPNLILGAPLFPISFGGKSKFYNEWRAEYSPCLLSGIIVERLCGQLLFSVCQGQQACESAFRETPSSRRSDLNVCEISGDDSGMQGRKQCQDPELGKQLCSMEARFMKAGPTLMAVPTTAFTIVKIKLARQLGNDPHHSSPFSQGAILDGRS